MARLVVSVVAAAVVGYVTDSPVTALQTFAFVYGATGFLDPNTKVVGSKLTDLTAPQASYGQVVAYVKGTERVAGNIVYATTKQPVANTVSQGKGGPGVDTTTYTYKIDIMYMLACNPLAALRRVFSNGKLIWSAGDDASGETLVASATVPNWDDIRFYDGNAAQLPDPDYEIAKGAGLAPAYRGRTTVFIKGLNLGNSGQVPVLTFEVAETYTAAATSHTFSVINHVRQPYPGFNTAAGPTCFSLQGYDVHVIDEVTSYPGGVQPVVVYHVDSTGAVSQAGFYSTTGLFAGTHAPVDVSGCLTVDTDQVTVHWCEGATPTRYTYNLPPGDSSPSTDLCFLLQGDEIIMNSQYGAGHLYRYTKSSGFMPGGGNPVVTGPAVAPFTFDRMARDENYLYCLNALLGQFVIYDIATLTQQGATLSLPHSNNHHSGVFIVANGALYYGVAEDPVTYTPNIWLWDGTNWTIDYPGVWDQPSASSYSLLAGADGDTLFSAAQVITSTTAFVVTTSVYFKSVAQTTIGLDQLIKDLTTRTGQLSLSQLDVTALAGIEVRGIAVTQQDSTRATLDLLASAFFFNYVELGTKILCVLRGGAAERSIPFAEVGISSDGVAEPFPRNRLNDVELPKSIIVQYSNLLNDYQPGAEEGDRMITTSTSSSTIQVPIVFEPVEAKAIADMTTNDLQSSLITIGPLALARKHLDLLPTNVVTLTDFEGNSYRARIVQIDTSDFTPTCSFVLDDATVVDSVASTDSGYTSSTSAAVVANTLFQLLDIPILRDADSDAGFYAQVQAGSPSWPGAVIQDSPDNVSYNTDATLTSSATFGLCATALGDWNGPRVFDFTNVVRVDVGSGTTLSSSTHDAILNDQTVNAFAIGSASKWELGQFITATYVSDGVYDLSGLLRGSRGTEWAMTGHTAGEKFSLLSTAGMARIPVTSTLVGTSSYYRALTLNKAAATGSPVQFTDNAIGLKPFSTFDPRCAPSGTSGDLNLTWQRRTRMAVRTTGPLGISIPLGEVSEAYGVDIYSDATYATVLRTLSANTTSVVYSSALQVADFGSAQTKVYFIARQLSSIVNRGAGVPAGLPATAPSAGGGSGTLSSVTLVMP